MTEVIRTTKFKCPSPCLSFPPSSKFLATGLLTAKQSVRTTWLPYGNMVTSTSHQAESLELFSALKLCKFDKVSEVNKHATCALNSRAGATAHIRELCTTCDFSYTACLIFLVHFHRPMSQQAQFGARERPSTSVFEIATF